jgi:hypothetical protein
MDERVMVGVIGLGTWGENHALAYSDYHRCELAVVCDLDEDRAREVGERITSPERHPIAQHLSPSSCPSTHANQDVSTLADAGGRARRPRCRLVPFSVRFARAICCG